METTIKTEKRVIGRSKSGLPVMWESGGGHSNTGRSTVICGYEGKALKPLYVERRGHLANSCHACFCVKPGYHVIEANHHRGGFNIKVLKITGFEEKDGDLYALMDRLYEFSYGEWDVVPPEYLNSAIEAARKKATCYHCREPHYMVRNES